jgi:hypothetical protein
VRQRKCPTSPVWSKTLACADGPCVGGGPDFSRPGHVSQMKVSGLRSPFAYGCSTQPAELMRGTVTASSTAKPRNPGKS